VTIASVLGRGVEWTRKRQFQGTELIVGPITIIFPFLQRSSIDQVSRWRMANMRQPRALRDGATYHVTARANRKEMILDSTQIKDLFLSVVKRAKSKYAFRLYNFCVMGNHYHFIIKPLRGENLSAIMRWIMSVFAMAYNRLKGLTGHVWGERFFSRILTSAGDYIAKNRYIDENPLRASLVANPRLWLYGGLWHHRAGCRDVVDDLPQWARSQLPDHRLVSSA
jgi:putative transposase